MGKIHVLRPRQGETRPVLIILASRGTDCLILCLRCLERFTRLDNFKKIVVLAEDMSEEGRAVLHKFQYRHANALTFHLAASDLPRSLYNAQMNLLADNRNEVILKLDANHFVTPGWLERMLEAYAVHRHRLDIPLVAPLSPISPHGRLCLMRFLRQAYPSERFMYWGQPVEENWVYHRWVWQKIIHESLAQRYLSQLSAPYVYLGSVSPGLVMFDARLSQRLLSRGHYARKSALDFDLGLNELLRAGSAKACVVTGLLVHHYGFGKCEEYLREHVPLELVWNYLEGLSRKPGWNAAPSQAQPGQAQPPLRLIS